eukprot:TRINITY_DN16344_c0_g1_i4.p1 TRINITY_DN16344_c0_g1~~TRINITY_DN16344_c0_g1_i4.p1  ORF type:complete len:327 (-),score=57.05 TRINITY_DN16344_c0_g1_i4:14-898(-)
MCVVDAEQTTPTKITDNPDACLDLPLLPTKSQYGEPFQPCSDVDLVVWRPIANTQHNHTHHSISPSSPLSSPSELTLSPDSNLTVLRQLTDSEPCDSCPIFTFPGAFPGQITYFHSCVGSFSEQPHAVLGFAFNQLGQILLVRHIKRGWELPGGKVDPGERDEEAMVRELKEEAASVDLTVDCMNRMGQYWILESKTSASSSPSPSSSAADVHIKTIFFLRVRVTDSIEHAWKETAECKFFSLHELLYRLYHNDGQDEEEAGNDMVFSPLLRDNVFSLASCIAWQHFQLGLNNN